MKKNILDFHQTASDRLEEGGDDVKSARPLWTGLHTCYNDDDNGEQECKFEQILKNRLSSDWCLQLDTMKMESLVIADQHAAVNMYLSLVHTARHTMEIDCLRSFETNDSNFKPFQFKVLAKKKKKNLDIFLWNQGFGVTR